jgi:hypothetical protein
MKMHDQSPEEKSVFYITTTVTSIDRLCKNLGKLAEVNVHWLQ